MKTPMSQTVDFQPTLKIGSDRKSEPESTNVLFQINDASLETDFCSSSPNNSFSQPMRIISYESNTANQKSNKSTFQSYINIAREVLGSQMFLEFNIVL